MRAGRAHYITVLVVCYVQDLFWGGVGEDQVTRATEGSRVKTYCSTPILLIQIYSNRFERFESMEFTRVFLFNEVY